MKYIPWAALLLGLAPAVLAQTSRSAPVSPIQVQVVDGRVGVSVTGLRVPTGTVTLTWVLATPGYRFKADSVNFGDAQGYFRCGTFNEGTGLRCLKSADSPAGRWRYTIALSAEPGSAQAAQTEPNFWIQDD